MSTSNNLEEAITQAVEELDSWARFASEYGDSGYVDQTAIKLQEAWQVHQMTLNGLINLMPLIDSVFEKLLERNLRIDGSFLETVKLAHGELRRIYERINQNV